MRVRHKGIMFWNKSINSENQVAHRCVLGIKAKRKALILDIDGLEELKRLSE